MKALSASATTPPVATRRSEEDTDLTCAGTAFLKPGCAAGSPGRWATPGFLMQQVWGGNWERAATTDHT